MGMARKVKTSAWWSAGRVFNSVTYSFIAQKLIKAKKTSDRRLLTMMAAKKTAAMIHHARTRAASSVKSARGRAHLSAATAADATTRTPSTSSPICVTGESALIVAARFIRSTPARFRLRQLRQRAAKAVQAGPHRQQRGDGEDPEPRRQHAPAYERN